MDIDKIKHIEKEMKKVEKNRHKLINQQYSLEDKRDNIIAESIKKEKMLQKYKWGNYDNEKDIIKLSPLAKENPLKIMYDIFSDGIFLIELEEGVSLDGEDRKIKICFDSFDVGQEFIEKNKLIVDNLS